MKKLKEQYFIAVEGMEEEELDYHCNRLLALINDYYHDGVLLLSDILSEFGELNKGKDMMVRRENFVMQLKEDTGELVISGLEENIFN